MIKTLKFQIYPNFIMQYKHKEAVESLKKKITLVALYHFYSMCTYCTSLINLQQFAHYYLHSTLHLCLLHCIYTVIHVSRCSHTPLFFVFFLPYSIFMLFALYGQPTSLYLCPLHLIGLAVLHLWLDACCVASALYLYSDL